MTKSRYNPNLFHKSKYLISSFFNYNNGTCAAESGLVIKKRELPKTLSLYINDTWTAKQYLSETLFVLSTILPI